MILPGKCIWVDGLLHKHTNPHAHTKVRVENYPGGTKRHPINSLPYHNNNIYEIIIISDICASIFVWMNTHECARARANLNAPSNITHITWLFSYKNVIWSDHVECVDGWKMRERDRKRARERVRYNEHKWSGRTKWQKHKINNGNKSAHQMHLDIKWESGREWTTS